VQSRLREQAGVCAICPRELDPSDRKLGCCGDHYETENGVRIKTTRKKGAQKHPRALLCQSCNSALGFYEAENGQRAAGLLIPVYEAYRAKYGG
jgi:hypothetical protein